MIAMQYRFVLPRSYEMGVIERRIAEKGPVTDDFPGLGFKAYLWAIAGEDGPENLYAPFYLWREDAAMTRFLGGPIFKVVSGDFGWPVVRTWLPWRTALPDRLGEARFATREIRAIAAHADLAALERQAAALPDEGALADVIGYDPTGWTQIRFRLWAKRPDMARFGAEGAETYRVGHVSRPSP